MGKGNLFASVPADLPAELSELIANNGDVRIERIVSKGHMSPDGFWYDQDEDEWVVLLSGAARLQLEGESELELAPGDYMLIPAHCKHRVNWTTPDQETVWLAIFSREPLR